MLHVEQILVDESEGKHFFIAKAGSFLKALLRGNRVTDPDYPSLLCLASCFDYFICSNK